MQCKGIDFVRNVVAKFPHLRRPKILNARLDYRTGKLISVNPGPNQQQPIIIDPQENVNQNGEVLRDISPPNVQNGLAGFQSSTEEIELIAQSMGFEREHIQVVIQR